MSFTSIISWFKEMFLRIYLIIYIHVRNIILSYLDDL